MTDIGVDTRAMGATWQESCRAIDRAVGHADLGGFVIALRALGPLLACALPHTADDTDELPNEMSES